MFSLNRSCSAAHLHADKRKLQLQGMLGNGTVAVKKLSTTLDMHEKKFSEEVRCLLKVRHKNIVRFLGYCADTQGEMIGYEGKVIMADVRNRLLCFEFVPNGSLHDYITGRIM
jgi:serine/threonine protein kinase